MERYRLELLGPFGLFDPAGNRVELTSKRGMALVALLATARGATRSRGWLQDMLWGSRQPAQAQASLRRELCNLRGMLNAGPEPLLIAGFGRVSLNLGLIAVGQAGGAPAADFLEGLDIPGEEAFEDWLREQRRASAAQPAAQRRGDAPSAGDDQFLRRAAVAVLPFANLTGDAGNDYLAQAAADDLIEHLSRLRWIPVIARATTSSYSSATKTHREIGRELGARYIVEGRLRGYGEQLGLASSISDADSGRILWSRRLELAGAPRPEDVAALITEVSAGLSGQLDSAEMSRAVALSPAALDTDDLIWRARWHLNQYTREDAVIAERLFEEALAKAPHSPEAIIQYALFKQRQLWVTRGSPDQIRDLRRLAQRAIAADYCDGRGYMVAGLADLWLRDAPSAMRLFEQAITLNPSLAYAYAQLGAAQYLNGLPEAALQSLQRALRLDIGEIYGYYVQTEIAMARAMLGDWTGTIDAVDGAISRRPAYWYAHVVKIYALSAAGLPQQAAAAGRTLITTRPTFSESFIEWLPFVDRAWNARLVASLRTAIAG